MGEKQNHHNEPQLRLVRLPVTSLYWHIKHIGAYLHLDGMQTQHANTRTMHTTGKITGKGALAKEKELRHREVNTD